MQIPKDDKDRQILDLLKQGKAGKEIAATVFITERGLWRRIRLMRLRCNASNALHLVAIYYGLTVHNSSP